MKKNFLALVVIIAGMAMIIVGCKPNVVTPAVVQVATPSVSYSVSYPKVLWGKCDTVFYSTENADFVVIGGKKMTATASAFFVIPFLGSNIQGGDTTFPIIVTNTSGGIVNSASVNVTINISDLATSQFCDAFCSKKNYVNTVNRSLSSVTSIWTYGVLDSSTYNFLMSGVNGISSGWTVKGLPFLGTFSVITVMDATHAVIVFSGMDQWNIDIIPGGFRRHRLSPNSGDNQEQDFIGN